MKGIVFNLLEEVVTRRFDANTWDSLLDAAGVDGAYTSLGSYGDDQLGRLVGAAATALKQPPQEIVRWFGREALPLLAVKYPQFFRPHADTRSFLVTLNGIIHPEVRKIYPGADTPEFEFVGGPPGSLTMIYRSRRRLCAFAEGLIVGAAVFYGHHRPPDLHASRRRELPARTRVRTGTRAMTLEQAQLELKRLENRLLRERRARAAAEEMAESGMRQLYTRQQHLALLQRITEAANATSSFRDTIEIVLAAVCADGGWDAGHVYYVERRPDPVLISSGLWHSQPHRTFSRLREVSAQMALAPGQGLPGRVLQSAETVWVAEIDRDKNCPRRELGVLDAHGAFAFPVLVHDQVVAVFEFFNAEPAPLNMELIALTRPMGVQLGRIFERQAAEGQCAMLRKPRRPPTRPNRGSSLRSATNCGRQ